MESKVSRVHVNEIIQGTLELNGLLVAFDRQFIKALSTCCVLFF